jgi:hypothetical protein
VADDANDRGKSRCHIVRFEHVGGGPILFQNHFSQARIVAHSICPGEVGGSFFIWGSV